MPLRFTDANGAGYTTDAITAIDYAVQAKELGVNLRVLNNSWGGGAYSQALADEISLAGDNGTLFVAAAGNNSGTDNDVAPSYPASYNLPNIIAVAATDNQDNLAPFSNYGASSVHLGAPGVMIDSTLPTYPTTLYYQGYSLNYAFLSGTSMAAPHVAGAATLVLAAPGLGGLTVAQLKNRLLSCGDPDPALAGKTITGKRLDVYRAIVGCSAPTYTLTLSSTAGGTVGASPPGPTYPAGTPVTLTATAFSGYAFMGWTLDGAPAGNANPGVLTMDANHTVVATFAPIGGWSPWASQGGILTDSPAAASLNSRVYVFAKGSDDALYVKSTADGVTWTNWTSLDGILTAAPAAAGYQGRIYAFAKGSDDALYVKSSTDGINWTDWTDLDGTLAAAPAAAATGDGATLYAFGTGPDGTVSERHTADGAGWTGWAALGGQVVGPPAAASVPNGLLFVFARWVDNALWERHLSP